MAEETQRQLQMYAGSQSEHILGWFNIAAKLTVINRMRESDVGPESAVNQLVSGRMVKQQQMHWTRPRAHLRLQVRAQLVNGNLRNTFSRRYPSMKAGSEDPLRRVARSQLGRRG